MRFNTLTGACAAIRPRAAATVCVGALALSVGTAAHAADVTLYGLIDTGIAANYVAGSGSRVGTQDGGESDSRFGLRGTEDLGRGNSVRFELESGFNPTTGTSHDRNRLFNYGAWVGLNNAQLGEVRFGRQRSVGQQFGDSLEIAGWKDYGLGATFRASDEYQMDNVINYFSPSMHGLRVGVGYSFGARGQGRTTREADRALSVGLKYESGAWGAIATVDTMWLDRNKGKIQPRAYQLGASYDFQPIKVALGWSRQENGFLGLNGGDYLAGTTAGVNGLGAQPFVQGGAIDAYYVGASAPIGAGTLSAQISAVVPDWDKGGYSRPGQVYSLGYAYPMSKRTNLYAYAGHMKNVDADTVLVKRKSESYRAAVGIKHVF